MKFSLLFAALIAFVHASDLTAYEGNEIIPNVNNRLNLFSWYQYFMIGLFSPEALTFVEKMELAAEKSVTIVISDFDFKSKSAYHRLVNEIPIETVDDGEDFNEYESEEFEDKLIVRIHSASYNNGSGSTYQLTFNLYNELFSSAIAEINAQRIEELLVHGLAYKLSRDNVFNLLSSAIEAMLENSFNEETYEITKMLLATNNFAVKLDQEAPKDSSANWTNLFMNIFHNREAAQLFMRHDPFFFSCKTDFNYVALEISRFDFKAALNALDCGVNPAILFNGRNALDVFLAATEIGFYSEAVFQLSISFSSREKLREKLTHFYPELEESMSFDNFSLACTERRLSLAERILKSGEIVPCPNFQPGNATTSPLSRALQTKDFNIINLACELFCDSLTLNQANYAKRELLSYIDNSDALYDQSIHEVKFWLKSRLN